MIVERSHKVTALLSVEELGQLQQLADDEGTPATQLLRALIKRAYVRRFGQETPRPTPATVRGLLDDLTGRAHYTAGNIAERMGVSVDVVLATLLRLAKRGLVEREQTHSNKDTTWRSLAGGRDATIEAAEKKKLDLDEPLVDEKE